MNFAGYELAKRALERGGSRDRNGDRNESGSGGESEANDGEMNEENERLKEE
jgi:hypothetical protein